MIITVASGKGGTGKTTVAVNLALSLDTATLMDCDVEEPNVYLFLNPKNIKSKEVTLPVPVVDMDRCTLCKKCAEFCEFNAIFVGQKVLIYDDICHSCGGCRLVCPEKAISEVEKVVGTVFVGQADNLRLAYGELRVGEPVGIPLIKKVKAEVQSSGINIIDAPPGTSCPVIETMEGSDYILLVTEPTPFGIHDLSMAIGVVKELGIPHGIVVNRHSEGNNLAREFSKETGIPIVMEIPYERRIAELYSRGIPFTQEMGEWKARFKELYSHIVEVVKDAN